MKHIFYSILLLCLTACSADDGLCPDGEGVAGSKALKFGVRMSNGSGVSVARSDRSLADLQHNDFIVDKSRIFILNNTRDQRTRMTHTDFILGQNPDLQAYHYRCVGEDNHLYKNHFYNPFQAIDGSGELTWDNIKYNGTNNYEFTAMYCPVTNAYDDSMPYPQPFDEVGTDQSTEELFRRQDILIARHLISLADMGETIYLTFYHMLSMVRVNVIVPVYEENTDGTGFPADSQSEGVLTKVFCKFKVDFGMDNTNNDAMLPCEITDDAVRQEEVKMFPLSVSEPVTGTDGRKEQTYSFVGIIPFQIVGTEDINSSDDEKKLPLFKFRIKDRAGNVKTYDFWPTKSGYVDMNAPHVRLEQGKLTDINLRIKRESAQPIMIGAVILPWELTYTDVVLDKDETLTPAQ